MAVELGFIMVQSAILGLVATFSPCLFPVLPTFIAFISGKEDEKINPLIASSLVTLGIMIVFLMLTFLLQSIIGFFAENYEFFRATQGLILVFFGILMLTTNTVNWNFLNKLTNLADQTVNRTDNPYLMSFLIGLVFSLLAAPCAIIVFGTFFFLVSGQTLVISILATIIFSLGAGLPFFLLSSQIPLVKNLLQSNSRDIHKWFYSISSVLIILVGVYLFLDGMDLIPNNSI